MFAPTIIKTKGAEQNSRTLKKIKSEIKRRDRRRECRAALPFSRHARAYGANMALERKSLHPKIA